VRKFPDWAFKQTAKLKRYQGHNAFEEGYADPITVRCVYEQSQSRTYNQEGELVTSSAKVFLPPDLKPPEPKDLIEFNGYEREVLKVEPKVNRLSDERSHTEVKLK